MSSIKTKYLAITFLIISIIITYNSLAFDERISKQQECFMVLMGKKATESGRVMLAHNNDLTGNEVSFVEIIPAKYDSGFINVNYSTGLTIKLSARTYKVLIQRIEEGYEEGDAVAINEFGVVIAGGVALGSDRNQNAKLLVPLIPNGLPGGIRYDILARSKTARECVKILGETYSKYGVSYPSGIGIADSVEIWYIECGGGKQWAAIRIPDSCYWVQANGYRIGVIDTMDEESFLTSPGLFEFCSTNGIWNPQEGPFDFANVFGGGRSVIEGGLKYDRLRVWRAINLLSPSLGLKSDQNNLPKYLKPDKKITELDLFEVLRDFYEGTDYDKSLGDRSNETIRSIATWKGVHSSLIVITPSKPIATSTILWSGIGSSYITGFTPIPFGVTQLPSLYSFGGEGSAFYKFSLLAEQSLNDWAIVKAIQKSFSKTEKNLLLKLNKFIVNESVSEIDEQRINLFVEYGVEQILQNLIKMTEKN